MRMCSVSHVAVGAVIGSFLDSNLLSFAVGLASHIPLDMIPHFDFQDIRIDIALTGIALGALVVFAGFSPVTFCAIGAVIPDFENLLWKTGVISEERKIFPTHSGLIGHGRTTLERSWLAGVTVGVLSIGVVVLVLMIGG